MSENIRYETVRDIVGHYGRPRDFAERFGHRLGMVTAFVQRGRFSSHLYVWHNEILKADGIEAPPSLWSQELPDSPK